MKKSIFYKDENNVWYMNIKSLKDALYPIPKHVRGIGHIIIMIFWTLVIFGLIKINIMIFLFIIIFQILLNFIDYLHEPLENPNKLSKFFTRFSLCVLNGLLITIILSIIGIIK